MGFWVWFWIWTVLVIGSLVIYALFIKSLYNRGLDVAHQLSRIAKSTLKLVAAMEEKPTVVASESDILGDIKNLKNRREQFLRHKSKKQAARQRRLMTELKRIDVNESRFTND